MGRIRHNKKLGFWAQVALIFFTVSGGAYGLEPVVGAVGPKWAIILVLVLPLVWAVPISLMVAELSSAIPESGGYYVWVRRGLGRFWGFQEGWVTLCYACVDLALYPVLFVSYLGYFFPWINLDLPLAHFVRFVLCLSFVASALLLNLRGIQAVGFNAVSNLLIVSFPFVAMTLYGFFSGDNLAVFNSIFQPHDSQTVISYPQLATGLAIILWNYCGWDNVSTYAAEVENPQKNYPKALFVALFIIVLTYLLPLLAGLKATTLATDWSENAGWPTIAAKLGGPTLGMLGAIAALFSAWSLFNSQVLYVSRLPAPMAEDGWLPGWMRAEKNGSPRNALILICAVAVIFSTFSLSKLMIVDILFYTLGLSLEFLALIALRTSEPKLARPFRIPLSGFWLSLLAAPPILLALAVALFSTFGSEGSFVQVGVVVLGLVLGLAIYYLRSQPDPISRRSFSSEIGNESNVKGPKPVPVPVKVKVQVKVNADDPSGPHY